MERLDDALANELRRVAGTAPVWPDPVARVRAAAGTQRRHRIAVLAAACAVVAVAGVAGAIPRFGLVKVPAAGSGQLADAPKERGMQVGKKYRFTLYTHCGIEFARFDGRWWHTAPLIDRGNPPRGWGNPSQRGKLMLLDEDRAEFRGDNGKKLTFTPANEQPPMCM